LSLRSRTFNRPASGGSGRQIQILLVEDSIADATLVAQLLQSQDVCHQLHTVNNGDDAVDFLWRRGRYADVPVPDIILLDLNIPRKSGLEVLADIKCDPLLKSVPVIVLTSSASQADVRHAYSFGANLYCRKPADLDETERLIQTLVEGWLRFALLPSFSPVSRSTAAGEHL